MRKRERGPWWTWLPLLRKALRYARPYWHLVLGSILMIAATSALSLLAPWPLAIIVDSVLGSKPLPHLVPHFVGTLSRTDLLIPSCSPGSPSRRSRTRSPSRTST